MKLQLDGKLIGEFHTLDSWLKNAISVLSPFKDDSYLCIDSHGFLCQTAEDIATAHEYDRFPVKAYELTKTSAAIKAFAL